MKLVTRTAFLILLLSTLAWPKTALAQGPSGDKYVVGGTYTLASGQTLNGNLFVLGGIATLEDGSQVTGDVMLAGGTLQVSGTIDGNIVATGGLVDLQGTALVKGDINTIAANLTRATAARVEGQIHTGISGPVQLTLPGEIRTPGPFSGFNSLFAVFWYFTRSFMWAALAILVVLFLPKEVGRTAQAIVAQPVISAGLGILTAVVFPLLLVVLAITLIGIPLSFLGLLLLVVAWSFGLITLGTEIGQRLAQILDQEWALAMAAGVGTFILSLVINGVKELIPCFGWVAPALAGVLGLGAVLLTRFGTQVYPPYAPQGPLPSAGNRPPYPPAAPLPTSTLDHPSAFIPVVPRIPSANPEERETPPREE